MRCPLLNQVSSASIVTVCLNSRDTIEMTLQSVRDQSFTEIEHVVIDGGSLDGTIDIVKSYSTAYFLSEADEGLYYAMEKGAAAATGDIVYFLNSGDTFYDQDVVADVVEFFNKTGSDAVFGNLLPCYLSDGDTHDHSAFKNQTILDLSYFNNRKLFFDESIHHQTIFYRKDIFNSSSFICENTEANGEYHLNMGAFVAGGRTIKYYPRIICRFALGGLSTANFSEEWQRFKAARTILRGKFFSSGRKIALDDKHEYLYFPPTMKTRIKIILRKLRRKLLSFREA